MDGTVGLDGQADGGIDHDNGEEGKNAKKVHTAVDGRVSDKDSASRSGWTDRFRTENRTGLGPVLPGPRSQSFRILLERLEKTAVLGPVRTGLGPDRDGSPVVLIFL